jgi:hypothetical protein
MACEEWRKLMQQCYNAEKAYNQAVNDASNLDGAEFDRAQQRAEEARKACLEFENALRDHELVHGCLKASAALKS